MRSFLPLDIHLAQDTPAVGVLPGAVNVYDIHAGQRGEDPVLFQVHVAHSSLEIKAHIPTLSEVTREVVVTDQDDRPCATREIVHAIVKDALRVLAGK